MSDTAYYDESTTTATFLVEADGEGIGRFHEVSGVEVSFEVEEHEEGGENGFVHKLPGRITWPNLVLKRGVTEQDVLMNWLQDAVGDGMTQRNGKAKRTTAAIVLMSTDGQRMR